MTEQNSRGISRRSITKGVAWAAPVVAVAAAAPIAAASHHEPPEPTEIPGQSCKTGGNSGTIKDGFYGKFTVTNNTGSTLTYTITSFQSAGQALTDVQVTMNPADDSWTGAGSTFTVPSGGTTTFWIRASGENSGNTSFTMSYTVTGFGGTYEADLTYERMDTCCNPSPVCPPYAYAGNAAAPTSSAPASQTQAPAVQKQAAETTAPATSAPATETKVAEAPATSAPASSAPATSAPAEAPASSSASE